MYDDHYGNQNVEYYRYSATNAPGVAYDGGYRSEGGYGGYGGYRAGEAAGGGGGGYAYRTGVDAGYGGGYYGGLAGYREGGFRAASPPPPPVDYGYANSYSERHIGRPGEPGFGSPLQQRYYAGGPVSGAGAVGGSYGQINRFNADGSAARNWGDGSVGGSFGFLRYADTSSRTNGPPVVNEVRWNDETVLSLNHYHHGDHHHHHHQRQVHHFHDMHLMGSADETLDLRGTPDVGLNVIGTDAPPQMRLRPDDIGRNAFVDLQKQIATGGGGPASPSYAAAGGAGIDPTANPYSPRAGAPPNSYWSGGAPPRSRAFSL